MRSRSSSSSSSSSSPSRHRRSMLPGTTTSSRRTATGGERIVERVTSTATTGSSGVVTGTTGTGTTTVGETRGEAQREFEALRARGLYHGQGMDPADRRDEVRVEQYVKEDAPVVEEQIRKREIHEVIPKVRREREVAEIRHAVLPIHDRVREERTFSERELAEVREREYRGGIREEERRKNRAIAERLSHGYRQDLGVEHEYRYARPEVEEVVRPRIIHEIHPVVQREIEKEHLEREYLPIRERIIEGPRVADEVEVLRPLSRDEWERTHGRALYERSGWMYGAPAEDYFRREGVFGELYDGPPGMTRRASTPSGTRTVERTIERRMERAPESRREYYDEGYASRPSSTYDMREMGRALEPGYYDDPRRARYESGLGSARSNTAYSHYEEPAYREHHGLFSGFGKQRSSRSGRKHRFF